MFTAPVAVATSMAHIAIMSLAATFRYARLRLIHYGSALWLLSFGLLSAQAMAYFVGSLHTLEWGKEILWLHFTRADIIIGLAFTLGIGCLGIFGLTRGGQKPTSQKLSGKKRPVLLIIGGIFFGALSALLGIGGGFLAVPLFIYALGIETKEAVATSLFCILITSLFTSVTYISHGNVYLAVAFITGFGSIFGAVVGSRIVIKADSEKIRRGFSILQLGVVVFYLLLKFVLKPHA